MKKLGVDLATMASGGPSPTAIALLRGINVRGRTVRMEVLTKALADFEAESIGAAGTLAIRRFPGPGPIARAVGAALPFEALCAIVPRPELDALLRDFGNDGPVPGGIRRAVTVLLAPPKATPALPLERPPAGAWQTRLLARSGRWIFSWYRRREDPSLRLVYPNEVVEREFGVPATTRWWETLEAVAERLDTPVPTDRPTRARAASSGPAPPRRGGTRGARRGGSQPGSVVGEARRQRPAPPRGRRR